MGEKLTVDTPVQRWEGLVDHVEYLHHIFARKLDNKRRNPTATQPGNASQMPLTLETIGVPCQQTIHNLQLSRGESIAVYQSGIEVQSAWNGDRLIADPHGKASTECSYCGKPSTRYQGILVKAMGESTGEFFSA